MLPLGNIIRKHGINFHCYADDTQLYISSRPDENTNSSKLAECLKDIKCWMMRNFLQLNSDKMEVLFIGPKNYPKKTSYNTTLKENLLENSACPMYM